VLAVGSARRLELSVEIHSLRREAGEVRIPGEHLLSSAPTMFNVILVHVNCVHLMHSHIAMNGGGGEEGAKLSETTIFSEWSRSGFKYRARDLVQCIRVSCSLSTYICSATAMQSVQRVGPRHISWNLQMRLAN
jgi:hypothetical protein